MSRLKYYWDRTKTTMTWKIAYRERNGKSILSDRNTGFSIVNLEKGTWGADPFLFDYRGETYLFYELFLEKKNKGVIACSNIRTGSFDTTEIVLEEDFHLSFPCLFTVDNEIYMIPETGTQHNIVLYKCESFPNKWCKEKILLSDVDSSDTIVYEEHGEIYVIASLLKGNPSTAQNKIYKLIPDTMELVYQSSQEEWGNTGYRNAGHIFSEENKKYRPGQNCENNQYGKGLVIWEMKKFSDKEYHEAKLRDINIEDVRMLDGKQYQGIHTYNQSNEYDVIDLRVLEKTPLIKRVLKVAYIIAAYFFKK